MRLPIVLLTAARRFSTIMEMMMPGSYEDKPNGAYSQTRGRSPGIAEKMRAQETDHPDHTPYHKKDVPTSISDHLLRALSDVLNLAQRFPCFIS